MSVCVLHCRFQRDLGVKPYSLEKTIVDMAKRVVELGVVDPIKKGEPPNPPAPMPYPGRPAKTARDLLWLPDV